MLSSIGTTFIRIVCLKTRDLIAMGDAQGIEEGTVQIVLKPDPNESEFRVCPNHVSEHFFSKR